MLHAKKLIALALLASYCHAQSSPITQTLNIDADAVPPVLEDNLPKASQSALPEELAPVVYIPTIDAKFRPSNHPLRDTLKNTLLSEPKTLWLQNQEVTLRSPELVQTFYLQQDYPLLWTQDLLPHALMEIHTAVQSAHNDALPVARYHADWIEAIYTNPQAFTNDSVAVEILLTDAFLTLARDLANGLVSPNVTQKEWNTDKTALHHDALSALLVTAANETKIPETLEQLNASNPRYQALKAEYKRAKGNSSSEPNKALLTELLKFGTTHPEVLILREKLGLPADSDYFDESLKKHVMAYQKKHKLGADGIVGKGTREKLNGNQKPNKALSPEMIAINMERQRWLPQELGDKYILVNIPSYRVKMYEDNAVIFNEKTVIGREERETPAFVDAMRTLAFAPTWTVPPTILKDKRATGVSDAYDLIAPGGKVVKPSEFGGQIPQGYSLRMPPGPNNPLGRVKFLFPNKHAIYLHDTDPSGRKWGKAASSGCVRIDKPEKFAQLLLRGKVNKDGVTKYMSGISPKTGKPLKPESYINIEPVPIYLVYWTMSNNPEEGQQIHQFQDVYKKDSKLSEQYQSALAQYAQSTSLTQESFAQPQSALSQ
ncbi:MAG: L,D-transpeptidase family protein [Cardiobacteriaceae bacterium]|nr:L,D-transpeptidase family protein [Cardiobacteriaceae bacterium]